MEALTDPAGPFLIGVRHHAPSLAAAVPALLDAAGPEVLLVELPAELQEWVPWLAHADTVAPVALAAVRDGAAEQGPAFYPFADFSPELAAVRWAARRGVPVVACDLPLAERAWQERGMSAEGPRRPGLQEALRSRITGRAGEDLWDRLVEAPAPGSTPEALRRAALLTGWALRRDAEEGAGVDPLDLAREAWMRERLREAAGDDGGRRVAAVVGAFHAPALAMAGPAAVTGPDDGTAVSGAAGPGGGTAVPGGRQAWTVSLIPYTYALLDERSGYPAGIRDPEWQHLVLEAGGRPADLAEALLRCAVRICAELRAQDQPSGPADSREIARLAGDLARLRGLPAAGRGELVEAVQTVLAQGEPLGRGRAVARALERVLVGERHGRPTPAAPRSGLAPAVEAELAALRLPGPDRPGAERQLRLDPLRTELDRKREVLLRRLALCGIPYGEEQAVTGAGGADVLSTRWTVRWTPATAAMLTAAGVRGVTSAQAAEGVLRERRRLAGEAGGLTAVQALELLGHAAACGLPDLAAEGLGDVEAELPAAATLPELLAGLALVDRLRSGHIAGLASDEPEPGWQARLDACADTLTLTAIRQLDGLTGSTDPQDAHALLELAHRADAFGSIRLVDALARLAADGTPLMRGAVGAVRVLLGFDGAADFGDRVASWVDAATTPDGREALTARLTGLLTAAGPLLDAAPTALHPLLARIAAVPDRAFLDRLPALRGGFDTLSPAARDRLLDTVEERIGTTVADLPDTDPGTLAAWTAADLAAREVLSGLDLLPEGTAAGEAGGPAGATSSARAESDATGATSSAEAEPDATGRTARAESDATDATSSAEAEPDATRPPGAEPPAPPSRLAPADRWRLLLGRRKHQLAPDSAPLAAALDELYGSGRGEGSRGDLGTGRGNGSGGGREPAYPGVREWAEELTALFGPGIREEVLAAAAAGGRQDAVFALDPDSARPSVELLRTVLQHAGGLPEARLAALRPLVRRLVDELTRQLATRIRPALTGLATPRPTSRPGGGLDLARTLRANLATARRDADGTVQVIPERPVFRSRARRSADWRLIIVTDVSGSMEASTVWAALTASILAGVPTLATHFLAFSTEVMDMTDEVHDPLGLLLEVKVGGGTHIAKGLRHARTLVTVPARTLVVVVSDFEEGYPLGGLLAEVRELVGSGCHLLGCASLDDAGRPRYSTGVAGQLVAAGMPVAALSPLELARWVGEKVR
ncbi:DUF5682 family protein [Streptomyces sp. NPDC051940]|uniref:DUF5682 family protein n=1 Tax=Streptomyces sp. NPDC051940 TaxID=3155675 RepID=UPI003414A8AB